MKSALKGFVFGLAAGIAIDALTGVSDRARPLGRKLADADLPAKADDLAQTVGHQLGQLSR